MKVRISFLIVFSLVLFSCSIVPITGRKQVHLLPESMMSSMALTNYTDFLKTNPPVSASDPGTKMVNKVGTKISAAVERYMKANNYADRVLG
jgi:hypothetical protein